MQPVNIDLKSDIVTEGDNLISSEPKFTHKNSLLFNGIASNMKKLTGIITYGFFSCGDGNYELKHDSDGWWVRKITV